MYITIIEDEQILGSKIKKKLERNGFFVNLFHSKDDFINNPLSNVGLFIVDISLGTNNEDGFKVIEYIRDTKKLSTPIIVISGFNDDEKKVYGFKLGIDDYIPKPFTPEELIARIQAILRRMNNTGSSPYLQYGDIILNQSSRDVTINNKLIYLTGKELQLLEFFITHPNKMISREYLSDAVWGHKIATENTINATISKVRSKLGKSFNLITKINEGYILKK